VAPAGRAGKPPGRDQSGSADGAYACFPYLAPPSDGNVGAGLHGFRRATGITGNAAA